MKIQISYTSQEEKTAEAVIAALKAAIPEAYPRYRENHPPRKHIYISIPESREEP